MTSTKVAFVTPGSFPVPSGRSSSVERVVEKFVPLLPPVAEPRIYGRSALGLARRSLVDGVICERFKAVNKTKYLTSCAGAIRRFNPRVIQVENRPHFVLKLKRRFPGKKVWLNLHSTSFIGSGHISSRKLRQSFRAADRIVVNSEFLLHTVAAKAPELKHKMRVVYPGVETDRFPSRFSDEGQSLRSQLRERNGLSGKKVVLFIGRLIPLKGVHHLLQAVPGLVRQDPDLLVVVVGSPYYGSHRQTAYSRKLHRLGRQFPAHVRFVPYVPYSEVPGWFLSADIAVVPSGQREAFGLVNVEAMACGCPVVATNAGGMKEIIVDGQTGYLITPANIARELPEKLLTLLQNGELRTMMGEESRKRVEEMFTWRHTADRWLSLLSESEEGV
ncbi:glycosyltransferase family 4 protein [Paenibacillus sp. NPDC058071]|uniref:glycosyltransferase family 4 protein n=1 Tax=Paenibacillus sp. NPDC058071 TaxID=3346326 RepID=UPI0036DB84E8